MKLKKHFLPIKNDPGRRKFIADVTTLAGTSVLLATPIMSLANKFINTDKAWTVGQIMELFIKNVPGSPFKTTVDTLKAGSESTVVTGIVTSMFPTVAVIEKAIALGTNFIIAHEPSFYNHLDETNWLQNDEVYNYKADLLKKHNIAIWRNHDYIHGLVPDGVRKGLLQQLNWEQYYDPKASNVMLIPATTLNTLIGHVKEKLNIPMLRYIGDLSQSCHKILLMPGASGGKRQIEAMSSEKPDVLLCGEISEWETAEYVRDAQAEGRKLSLVVLGHIASEEPGSEFMANWLKEKVPGIKVTHVPSQNSLSFI